MARRRWMVLVLVACLTLLADRALSAAFAQATIPNGVFVRERDGTTWLVTGDQKSHVPIFPATDDTIAVIADSGTWVIPGGDGQTGLALGAAPSFASGTPAATSAAPGATQTSAAPRPDAGMLGRMVPTEGAEHAREGTQITYQSRPPTSGTHYPTWVQSYGFLVPAPATGEWVHNLEHGAVVILYNCPDDCPGVTEDLKNLYPTLSLGRNSRGGRARVLILPYSDMDHRIAAVAWGWLLEQDDLDTGQLAEFVDQHIDRGPECRNFACP